MWYGKVDLAKHFMKYKVMSCVCVFVFVIVFVFLSPDGKAFVLVNPQTVPLHTNVLQCILTRNRLPSKKSTEALVVKINFFLYYESNIATGETSWAIASSHFLNYFHFFDNFHFFDYFHFFWLFSLLWLFSLPRLFSILFTSVTSLNTLALVGNLITRWRHLQ